MWLTAVCGGSGDEQAKLVLERKEPTLQVSFAKENCIIINSNKVGVRDSIDIQFNGKALSFYADSDEDNELWLKYCKFIKTFPNYLIPEEPRYNYNYKSAIKKFQKKYKGTGTYTKL